MRRISVSELTTFADCRRKHSFRYNDQITLIGEQTDKMLAGTLVHQAVQQYVKLRDGRGIDEHVMSIAETMLETTGKTILVPATKKAIARAKSFPQHYLENPALISEYPVEWAAASDVTVWGIPDLVFQPQPDELEIWELKTTENSYKHPLDFLLYNPQHRYYAVMLKEQMPELLVSFKYIVLGPKGCNEQSFLFTDRSWELTKQEILGIIRELGSSVYPNFRSSCNWCEYRRVCEAMMLGQNVEAVKQQFYRRRERHG